MATTVSISNENTSVATESHQPQSHSVNAQVDPDVTGIASARSRSTNEWLAPGAVGEDDMVKIGGLELPVHRAVKLGYIIKGPNGYEDANPAAIQKQSEETQAKLKQLAQQKEQPEPLDSESEEVISSMVSQVGAAVISSMVETIANGNEIPPTTIGDIASRMSLEPGHVGEAVEHIREAFTAQAADRIEKDFGVSGEAVLAWAQEHAKDRLGVAIKRQFYNKSTTGYEAVARDYMMSLGDSHKEWLLEQQFGPGVELTLNDRGTLLVRTPHGEFEWKAAIKMGLLKFSRGR